VAVVEAGPLEAAAAALADSAVEAGALAAEAQDRVGSQMRTREFLSRLEHDRIVDAIREAELKTSGEIRVFIQRGKLSVDPLTVAQKKFQRLGMYKTRDRNAVLIFVAPRAHKFAIVGDKAIHEKCGEEFWQRVVGGMRSHFQNEKFSRAIVEGIQEIGELLAAHFPRTSVKANELSDEIAEG
jgi:uncharacterized membrane protein